MMSKLLGLMDALFNPSKANPPAMDASPMTAMTFLSFCSCFSCVAMAMPNAADMELEACPAMKASYSLSAGFGNPLNPLSLRQV